MMKCRWIALCLLLAAPCGTVGARASEDTKDAIKVPDWAHDAIWYHVVVPRFRNGDTNNDPDGTTAWTRDWPATAKGTEATRALHERSYGGDLQGLREKLPYLKNLGINALILSAIFDAPSEPNTLVHHVDDALGVKGSIKKLTGETPDPTTWTFSESDRVFLDLLAEAHKQGFRIVVALPTPPMGEKANEIRKSAANLATYWTTPLNNGKPVDGVDGFVVGTRELPFTWLHDLCRKKPNLLIFAADSPFSHRPRYAANAQATSRTTTDGPADLASFFHNRNLVDRPSTETRDLSAFFGRFSLAGPLAIASSRVLPQLAATQGVPTAASKVPTKATLDRWRLASVLQFALPGTPLYGYGDEIGMLNDLAPMWWPDTPNARGKLPPHSREMLALVKFLNTWRPKIKPLRNGDFRFVMHDQKKRVFAFARSVPGDELILVANYGSKKQQVSIPIGRTDGLYTILSPQLKPIKLHPILKKARPADDAWGIPALNMGGSRQKPDAKGNLRFWVRPMGVRIVLVPKD